MKRPTTLAVTGLAAAILVAGCATTPPEESTPETISAVTQAASSDPATSIVTSPGCVDAIQKWDQCTRSVQPALEQCKTDALTRLVVHALTDVAQNAPGFASIFACTGQSFVASAVASFVSNRGGAKAWTVSDTVELLANIPIAVSECPKLLASNQTIGALLKSIAPSAYAQLAAYLTGHIAQYFIEVLHDCPLDARSQAAGCAAPMCDWTLCAVYDAHDCDKPVMGFAKCDELGRGPTLGAGKAPTTCLELEGDTSGFASAKDARGRTCVYHRWFNRRIDVNVCFDAKHGTRLRPASGKAVTQKQMQSPYMFGRK